MSAALTAQLPIVPVQVAVCEPAAGGESVPDATAETVALDYSRHGTDEVVVRTVTGDVYLITAPSIHQEYRLLYQGASAIGVLPGGGAHGADALVVSDSAGLHLLRVGEPAALLQSDSRVQSVDRIVAADWNAAAGFDLVLLDKDLPAPAHADDERIVLLEADSQGVWSINCDDTRRADICDFAVVPDWSVTGASVLYLVELYDGVAAVVHALDPQDQLAQEFQPFPLGSHPTCVQVEAYQEGSEHKIAMAWSQGDVAPDIFSYVVVAAKDPSPTSTYGFIVPGAAVTLRKERVRDMWCGSHDQDAYTDVAIAYEGDPFFDLYMSGPRYGFANTFVPQAGFAACLSTSPNPPQLTSGVVFADVDGDGRTEFGYGTDAAAQGSAVAFASSPLGTAHGAPAFAASGHIVLGPDVSVFVQNVNLPTTWTPTHIQMMCWDLELDEATQRMTLARTPFLDHRSNAGWQGTPPALTEMVIPMGQLAYRSLGMYGIVRYVEDSDPNTPGVDRAGPALPFFGHRGINGGYTPYPGNGSNNPSADYWTALNPLLSQSTGAIAVNPDPGGGGIPLIIDPVGVPPIPPLPPVPPAPPGPPNTPPAPTGTGTATTQGTGD